MAPSGGTARLDAAKRCHDLSDVHQPRNAAAARTVV